MRVLTWQNKGLIIIIINGICKKGFLFGSLRVLNEVPVLERSQARERAIGLPG